MTWPPMTMSRYSVCDAPRSTWGTASSSPAGIPAAAPAMAGALAPAMITASACASAQRLRPVDEFNGFRRAVQRDLEFRPVCGLAQLTGFDRKAPDAACVDV